MRFIFIADNTYRENNATFNICMMLARCMLRAGHSVTVLGNSIHPGAPVDEVRDGVRFVRFYYPLNPVTWRILGDWRRSRSLARLALSLLRHPFAAVVGGVRALTGYNPIVGRYVRRIRRLCAENDIDAVVAFTAPYYTARALGQANARDAKKILYMCDPYATHHEMGGRRATRQEARVLRQVDRAIVTPELYAEYEQTPLAAFRGKMLPAEFPGVDFEQAPPPWGGFLKDKINLFFAGNFYTDLRPASYLLDLVTQVDDPVLHFIVMGNLDREVSSTDSEARDRLVAQGKLTVTGPMPQPVAAAAMREADILINIGNDWPNMLPSKIYDYIVTGRPIVNLCRIPNCPSLRRLQRYPLALNLFEQDSPAENAAKLQSFARLHRGETLPKETIEANYADCTPQHLCRLLENIVIGKD